MIRPSRLYETWQWPTVCITYLYITTNNGGNVNTLTKHLEPEITVLDAETRLQRYKNYKNIYKTQITAEIMLVCVFGSLMISLCFVLATEILSQAGSL